MKSASDDMARHTGRGGRGRRRVGLVAAAVELPDLGAGCQRSFEFITPRRLGGPRYRSASG